MAMVRCLCQQCGKVFHKPQYVVNSKPPKYCGYECAGLARRNGITFDCKVCGDPFRLTPGELKENQRPNAQYCSRECYYAGIAIGDSPETATVHIAGNGSEVLHWSDGGKQMSMPRHRYLWELANGPIPKGRLIVHRDGNKRNNAIVNLMMMTGVEHRLWIGASRDRIDADGVERRECKTCGEEKSVSKFYKHTNGVNYQSTCIPCYNYRRSKAGRRNATQAL